jgi:uncharacterized protein YecE (DUF72 family)
MMAELRVGTSAFTAAGWPGSFYPDGVKPAEYLTYYATRFSTVEIDSTFYRTPSRSTVTGWAGKTPQGFVIAAKVPQAITHEKVSSFSTPTPCSRHQLSLSISFAWVYKFSYWLHDVVGANQNREDSRFSVSLPSVVWHCWCRIS